MDKKCSLEFSELSDEELAVKAKKDKRAIAELLSRYICTIEARARNFAMSFSDDLAQEGFIGFLKAVESYDENRNVKFSTYANVCIRNKMISAFDKQKDIAKGKVEDTFSEEMDDPAVIPENILVEKERLNEIYDKIISALSEQEWRVFQLFLTGLAYNQIALELNCSPKTVDNAMQRVRRKLKSVLRSSRE
ncbi:MAG: sigma-70 family RNA polymerase sigma factor [Oscillospiraceae bacterium]